MFDETPMRLRMRDSSQQGGNVRLRNQSANNEIAKILQTIVTYVVCIRDGGKDHILQGTIPTTLQVMSHCTVEVLMECVRESLGNVPGFLDLLGRFPRAVHMTCNDRASANLKAERGFCMQKAENELRLQRISDT